MISLRSLRAFTALAALAFAPVAAMHAAGVLPRLKVSGDHRFLVTEQGEPFFYLGDTAWELFHRLNREDADRYLEDRAGKGFTVIQAVALAEFGGLTEPNPYGQLPLVDGDPARPREQYFQHVDYVISKAEALGLYTGLLPTWGDKVNKKWGQGPEIFTPENARVFGEWIGRRYKDKPVIWILGGDRPIENERHRLVWRAMAEGIRAAVADAQLITYHPVGGRSSSEYVHKEPWLDFNMMQSGHGARNARNYAMIAKDLALTPPKPTLDGEPAYEDHPVRGDKTRTQWFDAWDVRKLCYWGVLAGACGHTYGTHSIWSMWDGKSKKVADQRTPWPEALALPGSTQVGIARRLIESRPYLTRVPDQSLITSQNPDGAGHVQAARDAKGACAIIYSASGMPFAVDLGKLAGRTLKVWWFDPRTGDATLAADVANDGKAREFSPPTSGDGNDWLLVLDDAAQEWPAPGAAAKKPLASADAR
jgi:hypothetical protein